MFWKIRVVSHENMHMLYYSMANLKEKKEGKKQHTTA